MDYAFKTHHLTNFELIQTNVYSAFTILTDIIALKDVAATCKIEILAAFTFARRRKGKDLILPLSFPVSSRLALSAYGFVRPPKKLSRESYITVVIAISEFRHLNVIRPNADGGI
jgi:hypothetical protein